MGRAPKIVTELDALMGKYLSSPIAIPEIRPERIIRSVTWSDEKSAAKAIYDALGQPSMPGQVISFGYLVAMGKLHTVPVTGLGIVARCAPMWAQHPPSAVGAQYHNLAEHFERIQGNLRMQSVCLEAALDIKDLSIPHFNGQSYNGRRQRSNTAGSTYIDRAANALGR